MKNHNRNNPTFANINLLGLCNAKCFFCLGGDLGEKICSEEVTQGINQSFEQWKNFDKFLNECKKANITRIYITGQNVDSLQYPYLEKLLDWLKDQNFSPSIRTNGILARSNSGKRAIKKCSGRVGYTINSLDARCNIKTMGAMAHLLTRYHWDQILPMADCRVSTVVHRWNFDKIFELHKYLSYFSEVKYHQLRRVSTDHRTDSFAKDIEIFENFAIELSNQYKKIDEYCSAPIYMVNNLPIIIWRTVETTVNSFNYFIDGTMSFQYFVVEGYETGEK